MNTKIYSLRNHFVIDRETAQLLWKPEILFSKLKKFELTKIYGGTVDESLKYQKEKLIYREAFQMIFPCAFNFTGFPFDSNTCCLDYHVPRSTIKLNTAEIFYGDETTNDHQIVIENLSFPFEIILSPLEAFKKVGRISQKPNYHAECV